MSEYYGRVKGTEHVIFAFYAKGDKIAVGFQRYDRPLEAKVVRSVTICDRVEDDGLTLCFTFEDDTNVIVTTSQQNYGVIVMRLLKKGVKVDFI